MTYVIGTAGHVDHGKSSLVQALTGIDPDRLAEEKARQMTIDLGFAWLTLPGGDAVGIVDVPGHIDFIENMLAGVGGIDLALLVIAADEGIMPQTREHLAILDLLGIPSGLVALTKIDLIPDPEQLSLVRMEVAEFIQDTTFENAAIIPVSVQTSEGLPQLLDALTVALSGCEPRPDLGRPRLPVDRVFSMSGFGTVVTGTLAGGVFSVGDEVEIAPAGLRARVRGLQSHRQAAQTVSPGSRAAINLGGIHTDQVQRGDVVTLPGLLAGTVLVDVRYQHHAAANRPLRHNDTVKFFSGATETGARVRLLGHEALAPGDHGWLQLQLDRPVALERGDRFILRFPSPGQTIGGGMVIEAHPEHRWRRFKPDVLSRLEALSSGGPDRVLLVLVESQHAASRAEIIGASELPQAEAEAALQTLIARGAILALDESWLVAHTRWARFLKALQTELSAYHAANPTRTGMPREALRSRLGIEARVFAQLAAYASESGLLIEDGPLARLPDHVVRFSNEQEVAIQRLEAVIAANPVATPTMKDAAKMIGEDLLHSLFEQGRLVRVSEDVWFGKATYVSLVEGVKGYVAQNGSMTVAQARDLFHTSRKYATALLEHLDEMGVTLRSGDLRTLK